MSLRIKCKKFAPKTPEHISLQLGTHQQRNLCPIFSDSNFRAWNAVEVVLSVFAKKLSDRRTGIFDSTDTQGLILNLQS